MTRTKEERESLKLLKSGATLQEAVALLPELTPEQLAKLDENGDWISTPESQESSPVEISTPPHRVRAH